MTDDNVAFRTPRRTTALGALTIFLPLFAVLLWWAFEHRVAPMPPGGWPDVGTLPAMVAVLAALFAAAGPSVLIALLLANHKRLRSVFRPSRGRYIAVVLLVLLTPFTLLGWLPWVFGSAILMGFPVVNLVGFALSVAGLILFSLVWYPAVCLVVSGVRSRGLRLFTFALLWWAVYSTLLLVRGYQHFSL